jgi:hypothetical protein
MTYIRKTLFFRSNTGTHRHGNESKNMETMVSLRAPSRPLTTAYPFTKHKKSVLDSQGRISVLPSTRVLCAYHLGTGGFRQEQIGKQKMPGDFYSPNLGFC